MERNAYSVREFCQLYGISRGQLYKLWKAGAGPISFLIGNKRMISVEAVANWQARLELENANSQAPWLRAGNGQCQAAA